MSVEFLHFVLSVPFGGYFKPPLKLRSKVEVF